MWKNKNNGIEWYCDTSVEEELPYNIKYKNKINNKVIDDERIELFDYNWLEDTDDWFHPKNN